MQQYMEKIKRQVDDLVEYIIEPGTDMLVVTKVWKAASKVILDHIDFSHILKDGQIEKLSGRITKDIERTTRHYDDVFSVNIKARDLQDAFFQAIECVINDGRDYMVESGSYEGQMKRLELDYVTIEIADPGARPLVPDMPDRCKNIPAPTIENPKRCIDIPPPTSMEYVEKYLRYLMTEEKEENEAYTYGERLEEQIWEVIRKYKEEGYGTNQCTMSVSQPSDIFLKDPPCLRSIDTRIFVRPKNITKEQELHFFVYFRSWDLWNGFPANLAAIRILQENMAQSIGVDAGMIIASSKGLHLYEHVWDIAKRYIDFKG